MSIINRCHHRTGPRAGALALCARMGAVMMLLFALDSAASAYTDQLTVERILNENKSYIDFMDACITNFGEGKADRFKEIYQAHFNAEVTFLQSDYKASFKRIYGAQGKLAELSADMVKNYYLENSKDILDQLAPEIIKSKNTRAKLYLTLGYRDRAVAYNHYTVGYASNPKLFSYKIFRYIDSIKMARRAKRYGFYALYESQSDEMKTKIFNHLFEMEREEGNRFYTRFLNKSGDSFLQELNKSVEDIEAVPESAEAKKEGSPDLEAGTLEKKVERRVRLRNEKTTAQHLLNAEHERAEDIIRNYVKDFNFKLIKATFEVLSAGKKEGSPEINYQGFVVHHTDNFSRYSKKSVLESFMGQVKVEDHVDRGAVEKEATEEKKAVDDQLKEKPAGKEKDEAAGDKEKGGKR